jgi:hypothetical protein
MHGDRVIFRRSWPTMYAGTVARYAALLGHMQVTTYALRLEGSASRQDALVSTPIRKSKPAPGTKCAVTFVPEETDMKILLTAVGAVLLSTTAMAGDVASKATATITFEALDRNADRQISRTEAAGEKALSESFASVDADGDGYVTRDEYAARTKNVEYTARTKY